MLLTRGTDLTSPPVRSQSVYSSNSLFSLLPDINFYKSFARLSSFRNCYQAADRTSATTNLGPNVLKFRKPLDEFAYAISIGFLSVVS
jgi:hypothetical protein